MRTATRNTPAFSNDATLARVLVATLGLVAALALVRERVDAQSLTLPSPVAAAVPGIEQHGAFSTAPLILDGATLFRVAVSNGPGTSPAALVSRVNDIQTALGVVIATVDASGRETATVYDPRSLRVHVLHVGLADALQIVDGRHTDPLPVVTVTAADAAYNETTIDALATQWQSTLESALIRALTLRQPAAQRRGIERVERVGLVLVLATVVVLGVRVALRRRIAALARDLDDRESAARRAAASAGEPGGGEGGVRRRRFLAAALRAIKPEQRFRLYRALGESLLWGLALAWFVAVMWGFTLFPQTTPLAQQVGRSAFGVATTLVVFALVNRVLDAAIARVASAWSVSGFLSSEDKARQLLRVPTVARAIGGFKTFLLAFVAVLGVLGAIGVPIGSVVTIGGLAAIALSLAAQNFVRDFVNGFLVLFEDHYVVGDYVTINAYSGVVEVLTLRMVQIRDNDGELITIPHSATTSVANQSRNWSRVDYRVPVDPAGDVVRALDLVRASIEELAQDDAWRDAVLEPVEWIGIEALSRDWAILRAVVRTAPLRQFAFRHAINARVRAAFSEAGIVLGAPIPGAP